MKTEGKSVSKRDIYRMTRNTSHNEIIQHETKESRRENGTGTEGVAEDSGEHDSRSTIGCVVRLA